MAITFLNDSDYIRFNSYNNITECTIGNSVTLHSTDFGNKYIEMHNLIHGDTPPM